MNKCFVMMFFLLNFHVCLYAEESIYFWLSWDFVAPVLQNIVSSLVWACGAWFASRYAMKEYARNRLSYKSKKSELEKIVIAQNKFIMLILADSIKNKSFINVDRPFDSDDLQLLLKFLPEKDRKYFEDQLK